MNKAEIIKETTARIFGNTSEANIRQITDFCDTLVDVFTDALLDNKKIVWKGFLSVEVINRGKRFGRNPQTNEVVEFPPVKSVKCKISQSIKDLINEE